MANLILRLCDRAVDAPALALLTLLAVAFVLAGAHALIESWREGRAAGVVTLDSAAAAEAERLRQDAYTQERRARLLQFQAGGRDRRAS